MNQSATTPPEKRPIDWEAIERDYRDDGPSKRAASSDLMDYVEPGILGNEKSLVRAFMHTLKAGKPDENIPWLTAKCEANANGSPKKS